MNAVEIEEAVSALVEQPFDPAEFPCAFLAAFGNKETTLKRLRTGSTNKSDVDGLLQRGNIHLKVAPPGQVPETLAALRRSPASARHKVKFILATDGQELHAEQLVGDVPPLVCEYADFPNHFAFFLPLAGITTVRQIAENAFDIRATSRLNRLYVELLKHNPDWDTEARREDLNHFFARLIFCFFAEDTRIFDPPPGWTGNLNYGLFTWAVDTLTERDGSNTHQVLATLFQAMNTKLQDRAETDLPATACRFPYVNGNLFSGSVECPKFSKIARSYLLFVGGLDWKQINPDIFGSMIQAVADDEERGALGMHYTSVPNILKVLNPLFLDDLRQKLEEAGDPRQIDDPRAAAASKGQLKRLRDRLARIRIFDPACGSGNFLVIAYKEMRKIEAEINARRGERDLPSVIPMTNFRGIEIRHFAAEIARLALIIAKFQCDHVHIGELFARQQLLPLDKENWITRGNALRLDWLQICPPTGTGVKIAGDDLFNTPLDQAEIDFENVGGETYICGNPPYSGSLFQTKEQKEEVRDVVSKRTKAPGLLDYVSAWFIKAADWLQYSSGLAAFVSTNSICQGQMVPLLWPIIKNSKCEIHFAHTSFKWANLASHNAGVTVAIICIGQESIEPKSLFESDDTGRTSARFGDSITPYLTLGRYLIVQKAPAPISAVTAMEFGNKPTDGGHLIVTRDELGQLDLKDDQRKRFIRQIYGSADFISGIPRYCIWIQDEHLQEARSIRSVAARVNAVREVRLASPDKGANALAKRAHQLKLMRIGKRQTIVVPRVSSVRRPWLPVGIVDAYTTLNDQTFAMYDAPLWNMAIIASRLHLVWIGTVCGKLKTDYRYSNTLGWNTFPVPPLTDQNKADLTRCAEGILLAREAHFPATIAELYDPEKMPADLRAAHDRNDETLERIYIGRRFRNDTERLEKLFELYTQMAGNAASAPPAKRKKRTS